MGSIRLVELIDGDDFAGGNRSGVTLRVVRCTMEALDYPPQAKQEKNDIYVFNYKTFE